MGRKRRPRLETRHDRAALADLVLPDPLLTDPRARIDPRKLAQREDLRGRPTSGVRGGLNATGDDGQDGRPVLARHGVDAAVRPVADIPCRHGPELIRDGTLD